MAQKTASFTALFRLAAGASAAAFALSAAPLAADVKSGVDAWSSGDYSTAVEQWRGPGKHG